MAKDKKLADLAKKIEEAMGRGVQEAMAALDADLKNGSPVDTGRFRLGWIHVESSGDPQTNAVPAENDAGSYPNPPPLDPSEVNPKLNQRIVNNLPYARRLCKSGNGNAISGEAAGGWSKKVAPDWYTKIESKWDNGRYLDEAFKNQGLK